MCCAFFFACRNDTFQRFHGVPPSTASIVSAFRASTSLPLRAGLVSSSKMCCSEVQLFALGEHPEEQPLAAGMWINRVTGTGEASFLLRK